MARRGYHPEPSWWNSLIQLPFLGLIAFMVLAKRDAPLHDRDPDD